MLGGYWSLLLLDVLGTCGLAIGIVALVHRVSSQRVERF